MRDPLDRAFGLVVAVAVAALLVGTMVRQLRRAVRWIERALRPEERN